MNPGLSLHIVTLLPRFISANVQNLSTTASSTSGAVTTSRRGRYLGGLKKCVMRNLEAMSPGSSEASSERGSVEVLDESMVSGPMCLEMLEYRLLLISRFSMITSTTQSKSLSFSRSSSMFPGVILFAFLLCMSISGFDLCIFWMAPLASALLSSESFETMSSRRTLQPAFAQ